MTTPASELLYTFVIEKASDEPLSRRATLYRAVAAHLDHTSVAFRELTKLADECEQVDQHCRQLALDYGAKEGT